MKRIQRKHLINLSKRRPPYAFVAACDSHDTKKERQKCHKGKIAPPPT